jgi:RNA polymerase sigma-70 factor (ECF subfamily)
VTVKEKDLVERLKKGNLEAFDMIYDMYAGRLYGFSMKYLRSDDEASELVQSVFMKVWENHKNLDTNLSFKSFLFTIAYNEICRSFRRKSYLRKYIGEAARTESRTDTSAETGPEFNSLLAEVEKIIAGLPERQRKAFIMCKLDGMPAKEVAAGLGLSPGTVDNYVSSTIKTIRRMLAGENLAFILFTTLFIF